MQVFTWGNLWAMPSTDKKEKYCHAMVNRVCHFNIYYIGGRGQCGIINTDEPITQF